MWFFMKLFRLASLLLLLSVASLSAQAGIGSELPAPATILLLAAGVAMVLIAGRMQKQAARQ